MLKDNSLNVCCVSETWLKKNDKAILAEIHDFGFDIISQPRKGRGGGVAVIFDPNILKPIKNNTRKYSSFEVLESIIKTNNCLIRLCVVYRTTQAKTNYENTKLLKFFDDFDSYLETLVIKSGMPIICGDFNIIKQNI